MTHASESQIDNLVSMLDGYASGRRTPLKCKCIYQRNFVRRAGPSGELSSAYRPRFRLCCKLQQADQSSAG